MVSSLLRMLTGRLSPSYQSSEVWIFHYIIFHQLSQYSPGTTTAYLQQAHHHAADGASEKYNLTWDQVTAEVIQKYLREIETRSKQKNVIEREEQIVEIYEELRDWSDSPTSGCFINLSPSNVYKLCETNLKFHYVFWNKIVQYSCLSSSLHSPDKSQVWRRIWGKPFLRACNTT